MGWGETGRDGTSHLQEVTVTAKKTSEFSDKHPDMHYKVEFDESGGSACFGEAGNYLLFKLIFKF